jgi:hypothetical protein
VALATGSAAASAVPPSATPSTCSTVVLDDVVNTEM